MKEEQLIIPTNVEDKKEVILRQQPTTVWQKSDLWLEDAKKFLKKYKWLLIFTFGVPTFIALLYFYANTSTFKEALQVFFMSLGSVIGVIASIFLAKTWVSAVLFTVLYKPVKRLMARDRVSFCTFGGEKEEVLTMRKTADEVILYRTRGSILLTLLLGKKKIYITRETYNLFQEIGEKKVFYSDDEEQEFLRVHVLPEDEVGEPMFIKDKEKKMTFNQKYLIDIADIEEFILKSRLPDVDPRILRRQLINLTKQVNKYREKTGMLEKRFEEELERRFWNFLSVQTPSNNYAKQVVRWMFKTLEEEKEEAQTIQDYLRQLSERYGEESVVGVEEHE